MPSCSICNWSREKSPEVADSKGEILRYPTPRVFCRKSAEVIENKGSEREKERKERSRVRKRKKVKEIEEVKGEDPARFVRDNTRNSIIDAVCLSIGNLSSNL